MSKLKELANMTYTDNGALTYVSSGNALVDLFFVAAGVTRNRVTDEQGRDLIFLFNKALEQDKEKAVKCLLFIRDIKEGVGGRDIFRLLYKHLANKHQKEAKRIFDKCIELGRFDDILCLADTKAGSYMFMRLREMILNSSDNEYPAFAKWLPTKGSNEERTKLARKIARYCGLTWQEYTAKVTTMRSKLSLVEKAIAEGNFESIDYSKVPSQCMLKRTQLFELKDTERFNAYKESVAKGEAKMNMSSVDPYQICRKYYKTEDAEMANLLWNNLPKRDDKMNSLAMIDTSGSMFMGTANAAYAALSLGTYIAENTSGMFKDYVLTFSKHPEMIELVADTFTGKLCLLENTDWGNNTDLERAYNLILDFAIDNEVPQEDMPNLLYIFSDMQFDEVKSHKPAIKDLKAKFSKAGYKLPKIVFWNLEDEAKIQVPALADESDVILTGGFSTYMFTMINQGENPTDFIEKILNKERYSYRQNLKNDSTLNDNDSIVY